MNNYFGITINNEFSKKGGKRYHYDGCSTNSLKEAKEFYDNMKHIYSGYTTYHGGIKNKWKQLHHFFIFK